MARFGGLLTTAALIAACGASGSGGPTTAVALHFDASTTTRKGETVQAFGEALDGAITEQTSQLEVVLGRLSALEENRDALAARVATLETENVALTKRLELVESKEPPAVDVLGTEVSGITLPAGTIISTLERLHEDVVAMSSLPGVQKELADRLSGLEGDLDAMSNCPPETTAVGEFCIEISPRTADFWYNAVIACDVSSGHICTANEYSAACHHPPALSGGDGVPELTSELVMGPGGYAGAAMLFDRTDCGLAGDPVDDNLTGYPYRCCYRRIAPDAGPPVTPPG
ncbi:MAG: hypothetical protein IV100_07730 [Myxococcales bacterium]|nr:hypothetical protein [Myxococcales bacterium]